MDSIFLTALSIFVLIFFSAFFSGSETAVTAASKARMHQLEKDGVARASIVNRLIEQKERLIGSILFGNNLVNILASVLAGGLFAELFGDAGVLYATVFMTALVLIFAEVLPKTYAISNTDSVALSVAPTLRVLVSVFAPIVSAVQWIVSATLRLTGLTAVHLDGVLSAHDELRGAIDLHHKEGAVVRSDRDRLGGVLDLHELEVSDVMVHRKNITVIDADDAPNEIIAQVLKSPHTRIPLWRSDQENIIGVLHSKDLLKEVSKNGWQVEDLNIEAVAAKPWFVPETTSLREQLDEFLNRRGHMALVVDEYGAIMGLVTLEDILEEIVGEISDEHDIEVEGVRPQQDGSIIVDGSVSVRDLNRAMEWRLNEEEATTVAGLVIHEAQAIPEVGQVFSFYGFKFEVLRRHRNQIMALRISPTQRRQSIFDGADTAAV
jgi:Mg2+/Co2+ transporter CorB